MKMATETVAEDLNKKMDRKRNLKPIYISVALDVIGNPLIIPIFPFFARDLGLSDSEIGLLIAMFPLAQIIGTLLVSRVSDKIGRRKVLLFSMFGTTTGFFFQAVSVFAMSIPLIFVARTYWGLFGATVPVAQAYITDMTTKEERTKYLGLIGATIGICFTVGPGLGAAALAILEAVGLEEKNSRGGTFLLAGFIAAFGLFYAYLYLEEPETNLKYQKEQQLDNCEEDKDNARENKTTQKSESSTNLEPEKTVSSTYCNKSQNPIWLLVYLQFSAIFSFGTMQTTYGLWIQDNFGWESIELGIVLVSSGLVIAFVQAVVIKRLAKKFGPYNTSFFSLLLLSIGTITYVWAQNKVLHLALYMVHVAGFAMSNTMTPVLSTLFTPPNLQGQNLGLIDASATLARVISPLVAGYLYENSESIIGTMGVFQNLVGGIITAIAIFVPMVLKFYFTEVPEIKDTPPSAA